MVLTSNEALRFQGGASAIFSSIATACVICILVTAALVSAQTVSQLNTLYNVTGSTKLADGTVMKYRLYVPRTYDKTKKYPLVLHMHGIGECGSNNTVQLNYEIGKPWVADSVQAKWAPFALAPQCPSSHQWAGDAGDAAIKLVDSLSKAYSIDTTRLYVGGLSWGGMGTQYIINKYTNKFAAALPCAGTASTTGANVAKTAFWAWHGDSDPTVNVSGSRNLVSGVEKAGFPVVHFFVDKSYTSNMFQMVAYNGKPGVSIDSLKNAIRNGAKYLYTEIVGGDHGHGCDMGWKCPLMVGWLFSKAKVNGQVVKWPITTPVAQNLPISLKSVPISAAVYSLNGKKLGYAGDVSLTGKNRVHSGVYLIINNHETRPLLMIGR